jgi:hypothetical protein
MLKANQYPEVSITNQIKEYFDGRSRLGWDKYGKTMDRTDLSPVDWLNHMIDELGDGLQYGFALRQAMLNNANELATTTPDVPKSTSKDMPTIDASKMSRPPNTTKGTGYVGINWSPRDGFFLVYAKNHDSTGRKYLGITKSIEDAISMQDDYYAASDQPADVPTDSAPKVQMGGFPCYVPASVNKTFEDIEVNENYYYLDADFDMQLCAVSGFVADPDDGNLIIVQLADGWIAVSLNCLYCKL